MLALLIPVLDRPQNVRPLLDSIRASTTVAHRVLFICDPNDQAEREAISREAGEMIAPGGSYAAKIRAGIEATSEPLIMLGADDVRYHPGWLEAARYYIDAGAAVVGLNDARPREHETATHFLITREYAELPTIDGGPGPLHTGYFHNFPDRELIETARHRGVYAYAADAVVEHRHHLEGHAPFDETYRRGLERFRQDRRTFMRRSALWS